MKKITFKKTSSFLNSSIYQMTDGSTTYLIEVTILGKDKIGELKRVECSKIGMFESYTMKEIKSKLVTLLFSK